ncbi:MAG: lytic transglycosylase domain-containing protein [Roseovarius sp.]
MLELEMQAMLRWCFILFVCLWPAAPVSAQDIVPADTTIGTDVAVQPVAQVLPQTPPRIAPRPLASAMHAMRAGRWERARALAARDGPGAEQMIDWFSLLAARGSIDEVIAFLQTHPDWPSGAYLRKQTEASIKDASTAQIMALFADHPAQTGAGVLAHARVLIANGDADPAEAILTDAWRSFDLSTQEHEQFIEQHGALLAEHHIARLDMADWRGLKDVEQMLPLVPQDHVKLIGARKLAKSGGQAFDDAFKALPKALQSDGRIAHVLFNRHIKENRDDDAIKLILRQSRIKNGLGQPAKWASWRRALARSKMRAGEAQLAYDLASVHQLTGGSSYSDLEWLSGYLALTYLEDAELALDHFQRFRAAVATPISLGRAGYWIGRAQEALGDTEAAQLAYEEGAQHQTSFYGLLAAERAGVAFDPALAGKETFAAIEGSKLAASSAVQAMILAAAMGDLNLAERFVTHLGRRLTRAELGQLAQLLDNMGEAHLQVMLGKTAARRGLVLHAPYYALHPMMDMPMPVPTELSLAIARRESEFDFGVVSGAGAQGLMQVMPGTARDVARDLALEHDPTRVLSDWQYNTVLGSTYLAQMAERFDGNIIMISAAYNAGPARPPRWIEANGDPRGAKPDDTSIVDWIEHIPFRETRNYVMRVSESLPIYRARLGRDPLPVSFSQELTGSTIAVRPVIASD